MPDVREWTSADTPAVDALLDTDPDPLWANQGHRLHGEPREGERWRRTWVAEMGGAVVGAVTVGRNWVHPDRYTCALEVAPAQRRRGIGRLLVEHARSVRPEPRPLNAKVRERDAAARGLATALGAVPYQRAPCPQVDPASAEIRAWCAQSAADVTSLEALGPAGVATAFADVYRWIHDGWAPVGSEHALAAMSELVTADADLALSCGLWRDGPLVAAAFAFREEPERVECVLETIRRDEADGVAAVAAVLAGVLTAAHDAGLHEVELDGHDTDPHLAPVVVTLPPHKDDPLLVVELL